MAMRKAHTSKLFFQNNCQEVWEAITSQNGAEGFTFEPMSDEEFEQAKKAPLNGDKALARVTDLTPGKSCAYTINAAKFDLNWRADLTPVGNGECRMVMREEYIFHPGAVLSYILCLLFIHQRQQHKDYRAEIARRLKKKGPVGVKKPED